VHEFDVMARSNFSIQKTFNGPALLDLIKELVRLDRHWIPQENGHSLYIRPALSLFLGVLHSIRMVLIGTAHNVVFSWHPEYHRDFTS
jgi:hypothetical protein